MSKAPCKECGVTTFYYLMDQGVCHPCIKQIEKLNLLALNNAPLKNFTFDGFKGTKMVTKYPELTKGFEKLVNKKTTAYEEFDTASAKALYEKFRSKLKESIKKVSYLTQKDLIEFGKPDPNDPWSENMSPSERAMVKTGKTYPTTKKEKQLNMAAFAGNHMKSSKAHPNTEDMLMVKKEQFADMIKKILTDAAKGDLPEELSKLPPAPAKHIGPKSQHHPPTGYKSANELPKSIKEMEEANKLLYPLPKCTGLQKELALSAPKGNQQPLTISEKHASMAALAGNHMKSSKAHKKPSDVFLAKNKQLAAVIQEVLADDTKGDLPVEWENKLPAPAKHIGLDNPHHPPTGYKSAKELSKTADKISKKKAEKLLLKKANFAKVYGSEPVKLGKSLLAKEITCEVKLPYTTLEDDLPEGTDLWDVNSDTYPYDEDGKLDPYM